MTLMQILSVLIGYVWKPSLGSIWKSETEYDILVTNPLGHSVIVNIVYRDLFH